MAKITEQVAIAVGVQSGVEAINATVRDATEIGETESGAQAIGIFIDDESLAFDFDRVEEEVSDYTGTFSKNAGTFQRVDVPLAFATAIQGGGDPTPETSGQWDLHIAFETLLRGLGLYSKTQGVGSTTYEPSEAEYLTIKIWRGTVAWVLQDCKVESLAIPLDSGSKSLGTWTFQVGSVQGQTEPGFPTLNGYGTQASLSAPILRGAACSIGGSSRSFIDGSVTISQEIAEYGDCNATTGITKESDGRQITFAGSVYADTGDPDQFYDDLVDTATPTGDMIFTLGDTVGDASNPAQAVAFTLRNMRWTQNSYDRQAGRVVWALNGYATHDGSGDDEFVLSGV